MYERMLNKQAVLELADEFERRDLQVTSFVLLRNGKKIAELCKPPYEIDSVQLWYSVTKSFTGIGVGIASDKGLLRLDDFVIDFFPDKLPPAISDNLKKLRVRHLLSMTCGIHDNTYGLLYPQEDWVKAFLAQELPHEPGTYYRYSTHASHMLAAIVERVSGQSFYGFIQENLFEPLEIYESTWETCPQGITAGGMGLGLTVGAVARFAQMITDGGLYKNKRIVSAEYLSEAMTEQSDDRGLEKDKHKNGYGYHMRIDLDGSVFHSGGFGMLWYACPRKNIAAALTSRRKNTDIVIDLLQEKIIGPASGHKLPVSAGDGEMRTALKNLKYPVPAFRDIPQNVPSLDGKTYSLSDNPHKLRSIGFKQKEITRFCIRLQYAGRPESAIEFDLREPIRGRDVFVKDIQFHDQKYVSYSAWENEKTLVLTIFYIETPYEVTYRLTFNGVHIDVAFNMNVSLNLKNFSCDGVLTDGVQANDK